MSVTAYPTLRLKLTMPQALKLQFLPAVPGSNASAAANRAEQAAQDAQNAANTAVAATADKVNKSGDVMTGFLTLNANPTANLQAATKQYVDSQVAAGGITPQLPVVGGHLAGFIDSTGHVIREVKVGATMSIDGTGTLNTTAGGGNVMAVGTPTSGQYAKWTSAVQIQGVSAATVLSDIGAQPLDADLTSLAAASATNQWYYRSAANTWSPVTIGANLTFTGGTLAATGGGGGAPVGAEYITSTADATLTSERVLTDTATVTWDRTTAGQIKANAAGGGGGASISISDTPPGSPTAGSMWWESDTGTLWIYYTDANTSQWVAAAPGSSALDQTTARSNIYAAPFDALAYNGMQINGSSDVSQERGNAGFTVTSATMTYLSDGWQFYHSSAPLAMGGFPQQATGLVGFPNSVAINVSTAKAVLGTSDQIFLQQAIEGYRIRRLGWGTAGAQPLSIGFWINASIAAGTIAVGFLGGGGGGRTYISNVVINAANTWEYKTVTVPGDTAGTWASDNTAGLTLRFCFGVGSGLQAPSAGSWLAGGYSGTAATTNFVATLNNVMYITGLIVLPGIELPSAARLPFIMRPYDQELIMCQRYYQQIPAAKTSGLALVADQLLLDGSWFCPMRAAPSLVLLRTSVAAASLHLRVYNVWVDAASMFLVGSDVSSTGFSIVVGGFTGLTQGGVASFYVGAGTIPFLSANARL
jgi:hypothetical protein